MFEREPNFGYSYPAGVSDQDIDEAVGANDEESVEDNSSKFEVLANVVVSGGEPFDDTVEVRFEVVHNMTDDTYAVNVYNQHGTPIELYANQCKDLDYDTINGINFIGTQIAGLFNGRHGASLKEVSERVERV